MKERTITLFQQMSDHTRPKCESKYTVPFSCCDPMGCDMAEEWAKRHGITLRPTDHPVLKFMGSTGCVVPPHLRPNCTLHNCHISSIGYIPGEDEWNRRYFDLREEIDQELFRESYDE